ncbi:MAG: SufS family cysteine desulfurase [Actinobacteria bacterium]|nr:SufS family cysteine desulfurase [Actinomycetota bacterium]
MAHDLSSVRADFPVLAELIDGKPLVYLDSANTSQKPHAVIDAMSCFLEHSYGPTNRSAYRLAADATDAYEGARVKVARFVNAAKPHEIVFTKNATESLNLVARAWGSTNLSSGDAIVLTHMEHHANIVPWQMMAAERGFEIRWVPLTADGLLDLTDLDRLLDGAKALSFTAMSNVLGTINPVRELCAAAHAHGAIAVVDGCQSVPHMPTDVREWDADFVAFSSHKMVGPSGIGLLWGRESLLESMPPFLGGGSMISDVRLDGFECAELPAKFEAGTQPIVEAVGLGAAVDYLSALGMDNVRAHEVALTVEALDKLKGRFGDDIEIHGSPDASVRGATISFAFRDVHPHDVSQVLDQHNVCVRAGHHCAKPLMRLLGANATVRASFYLYNTSDEIDTLCDALGETAEFFSA